jgi:hypothetical protein
MSRKSKLIAILAPLALVAAVFAVTAIGANDSGTSDKIAFKTGANASTPSGSFINVPGGSLSVTPTSAGPLVIRLSAEGSVRDLNSGGGFAGHKFAAMFVRVLVNGSRVGPVVRFFDNTGKVGVSKPRPTTASYEWAKHVTGAGAQNIQLQFKNLNAFDDANINAFTLTAHFH